MLGVDSEYFFMDGDLAVPAKDVIGLHPDRKEVFKKIASDIQPKGYWSSIVPLDGVTITEDGLAFELPVTPSDNPLEIINRLSVGLNEAWSLAESNGLSISSAPLVNLKKEDLQDHPELRVLGCSPDKCIHDDFLPGCPSQDPRETTWRTSGFHVHFSIPTIKDFMQAQSLVLACDSTLGLADVLFEHSELGRKRREMYGLAGKFRIQKWGVEYRTPSGSVSADPEYAKTILGLAKMLHIAFEDNLFDGLDLNAATGFDRVVTTINSVDVESARKLYLTAVEFLESYNIPTEANIYLPLEVKTIDYKMENWKNG